MIKHIFKFACISALFSGLIWSSCKNEEFDLGRNLVLPHTTVGVIDTVTIKVSNLMVSDSVITSGLGIGFSGNYRDSYIGDIETRMFIEFERTEDSENNRYAIFDSVTLILRPNGNYYGDTTKLTTFKVFRINKQIEKRDNGYLYSTSNNVLYDKNLPLAEASFKKMKVKDLANNEIEIKLHRSLGEELLQGIIRDDEKYKSGDFTKTFSGLVVTAGDDSKCVHSFLVNDSACMIRIYYHVSTNFKEEKTMTFKAYQYNSFYNMAIKDGTRTILPPESKFNAKSDTSLLSSKTGNMGFVMSGGTPIYTRLEFPHLNELLWLGQIVKIQKATLYVRPIRHSFDTVPLPPRLNVYYFDPTSNMPLSEAIRPPSMGSNTGPQYGNLRTDYQNIQSPDFPQYTFDVTDFIASQMGKVGYYKWALSLIIPYDSRESTIQRLVFGNQNYAEKNKTETQNKDNQIKLEVIYAVYND